MIHLRKKKIDPDRLPRHIAIIMDGNGRWARRRGLPRSAGHAAGAENFKTIVRFCGEIGISYLTVYAFSTENWSRPIDEVDNLMRLLEEYLDKAYTELDDRVRVRIIGEREMLSEVLRTKVEKLEADTADRTGMVLNIALSYGGRQEILHAVRLLAEKVESGTVKPADITEEMLSKGLYTAGQPDPDLIIRPSGEKRLSNFLLWQAAYAEFWYSDILWPSFKTAHLVEAIAAFQKRDRRFGGV
ncbi:MAG: isoprenyl transferase [Ruminococcaceae bacterium]|nr:isoprenyl transferase [Oscillospiraceae bacterium]